MLAIPALDISDGRVVHACAEGGIGARVDVGDPRDVARRWTGHGFRRLHVVDVDAATGRGFNHGPVRDLLWDGTVPVQVGGGIRTAEAVSRLLDEGAASIVVGSRAVTDMDWLVELSHANAGAVIVALDVHNRRVVVKPAREFGHGQARHALDFVDDLARLHVPLGGLLITALEGQGQPRGADLLLLEDIAEASGWPVYAAGRITTMAELRALEERGIAGAVIGMALYTGVLDARVVADEFGG